MEKDNSHMSSSSLKERFSQLSAKYDKLDLENDQLLSLQIIDKLSPHKGGNLLTRLAVIVGIVVLVVVVSAGVLLKSGWLLRNEKLVSLYFRWYDMDPAEEMCLVESQELAMDFLRPPVKCDFCKDVHAVERVRNLSQVDFERKFAYSARPVIITDGMANWTAPEHFSFNFFKKVYGKDSPVYSNERDCQFFPYKTDFDSLADVFNMSQDRAELKDGSKPWYIGWSNCDSLATNILRKHYKRPYFLPEASESSKTDWIFMGSPGYGAHIHIDNVEKPSWQAQVTGEKTWTLKPPSECYYQCPEHVIKATVQSGEIIVLDTNKWFHGTNVVSKGISITIGSEYD